MRQRYDNVAGKARDVCRPGGVVQKAEKRNDVSEQYWVESKANAG